VDFEISVVQKRSPASAFKQRALSGCVLCLSRYGILRNGGGGGNRSCFTDLDTNGHNRYTFRTEVGQIGINIEISLSLKIKPNDT